MLNFASETIRKFKKSSFMDIFHSDIKYFEKMAAGAVRITIFSPQL
jgi:hypothetical protein